MLKEEMDPEKEKEVKEGRWERICCEDEMIERMEVRLEEKKEREKAWLKVGVEPLREDQIEREMQGKLKKLFRGTLDD